MAEEKQNGHWITLENGAHLFIKKGQTIEDALDKLDDEEQKDYEVMSAREYGEKYSVKEYSKKPNEHKAKQFEIIQKNNPMKDDYHVGIRSEDDIKTFDEVIDDDESFFWGDFSQEDAKEALKNGKITIYSSYPIKQGTFVSTSKNQAKDYAGGGQIYSLTVPLEQVAWINGDEGQFAKV